MRSAVFLLAFVFGFTATLFMLGTLTPSNTEDVTPPLVAAPVEPVQLAIGDAVTIDGLTVTETGEVPVGKIVLIEEVRIWINLETQEEVQSRAITVEFTVNDQTAQFCVPELVVKKAQ